MVGELIEGVIGLIVELGEVVVEVAIEVFAGDEKKKDDGDD